MERYGTGRWLTFVPVFVFNDVFPGHKLKQNAVRRDIVKCVLLCSVGVYQNNTLIAPFSIDYQLFVIAKRFFKGNAFSCGSVGNDDRTGCRGVNGNNYRCVNNGVELDGIPEIPGFVEQEVYDTEYKEKYEAQGIEYFYTLIDDAVAKIAEEIAIIKRSIEAKARPSSSNTLNVPSDQPLEVTRVVLFAPLPETAADSSFTTTL